MSKVGQVLETPDDELLKIRNFGEKSLEELKGKIQELGLDGSGPIRTEVLVEAGDKGPEWRSAYADLDEDLPVGFTGERSAAVEELDDDDYDDDDYFDDDDEEEEAAVRTSLRPALEDEDDTDEDYEYDEEKE